ncbi:Geranylgeranyl pyrophosphate synthase protein [Thalictrum thalictroides]|uniref:Geranylgeranyl pyrophosphate synthase protein n=1 Tax=Thalictrum thalictroides TaxID=46969 RepID=A0A7J6W0V7_THATH|nr:Geranylgeranyl pyrophosphate synthase protein [Thalictrum thalictroides]
MSQNHTSWATINTEVEAHIEKALCGKQPPMVFDPMNHLIFEVPRSMAPALCIAACEAVGGRKEQAIPAASALHLMHVATYTHEYLHLSDKSMVATMPHHEFEPSIELLTADGMIPFGYELLAAMEDPANNNSESVLQVMIEIGRAMGSQGMINGQYLNVRCLGLDGEKPCDQEGMMDQMFEKKGGGLYSCGAACGAILGGGSDEEIEKLRRYGLYVGMIHGIMVHDKSGKEKRLLKLADSLRFLALKELEGMKDKNTEPICSLMDGFSAFLRVQKFHFPQKV